MAALSAGSYCPEAAQGCLPDNPLISLSLSDASLADSVPTCLGRNAPNAVLCSSSLTMKGAIILQHKYFIPHLDADLRCHTVNANGLSLP